MRNTLQEVRELGAWRTVSRLVWEFELRSGWKRMTERPPRPAGTAELALDALGLEHPHTIRERIGSADAGRLGLLAHDAAQGRILAFGHTTVDYGHPIDWHRDPWTGCRWSADVHWSRALETGTRPADIKMCWEPARFPQAYHMARAAAFGAAGPNVLRDTFESQVCRFLDANPPGSGVHWHSSQEIVIRCLAWLFAAHVFSHLTGVSETWQRRLAEHLGHAATHVHRNLRYARDCVYNNHLIYEALGLYVAGVLLPRHPGSGRWLRTGRTHLDQQAERQFYPDGGYIQNSHNYHRAALQAYLWASSLERQRCGAVPAPWLRALERSVDFLHAQQNAADGRLPNHGANDGALPAILSTCEYGDFRPALQAANLVARGQRLYPAGPWDEEAAWFAGVDSLAAAAKPHVRQSVSFAHTGHHVLRGSDGGSFCTLRCGTVLDRFAQVDMLHLDVWWRGENVLADAGSYSYNGPAKWHNCFYRTASHNTVTVDGLDQMLHHRRFKNLYRTEARLKRFTECETWALCEGEHYGYRRRTGCVHSRAVLYAKDNLWIVVDTLSGDSEHSYRLHWLCGDYPHVAEAHGVVALATPQGPFRIQVFGSAGAVIAPDIARGEDEPPRGWLSRHYGVKSPVASLAYAGVGAGFQFVSVLSPDLTRVAERDGRWTVWAAGVRVGFVLAGGTLDAIEVDSCAS